MSGGMPEGGQILAVYLGLSLSSLGLDILLPLVIPLGLLLIRASLLKNSRPRSLPLAENIAWLNIPRVVHGSEGFLLHFLGK